MPKKQPNPQFGTDTAPDNVSMPTLNAMQRPTVIETVGKNIQRRAARAARPAGNPCKSGWNDPEHAGLLGF